MFSGQICDPSIRRYPHLGLTLEGANFGAVVNILRLHIIRVSVE